MDVTLVLVLINKIITSSGSAPLWAALTLAALVAGGNFVHRRTLLNQVGAAAARGDRETVRALTEFAREFFRRGTDRRQERAGPDEVDPP
jgi:hypothetical protein